MTHRQILLGPPGTGKTERLLTSLTGHLLSGTDPERIGFVSFSRRAVHEAVERARQTTDATFPHFRTIHSTAYHLLNLTPGQVFQHTHLEDFGEHVGFSCQEHEPGGRALALLGLSRARCSDLYEEWRAVQDPELPWALVHRVTGLYGRYKAHHGLYDFHDMIEHASGVLDLDVLFVDEAQDTSVAQWAMLKRVAHHVPVVYFAGDDDQAVYNWSGADSGRLARLKGQRVILPQSHRLPRAVKAVADRLVARIRRRIPKPYQPRDEEGRVQWINDLLHLDLHEKDQWLLLARSNFQLRELRALARQQGVVYTLENGEWSWTLPSVQAALTYERLRKGKQVPREAAVALQPFLATPRKVGPAKLQEWDAVVGTASKEMDWMGALPNMPLRDREYVRALRRTGESLIKPGRVRIDTVHGAKGAQADHVVLLTDVTDQVSRAARLDPDAELRVQYVGVTRARHNLYLLQPTGATSWTF